MAAPTAPPATPPSTRASVDLVKCEVTTAPVTAPSTPPTTVAVLAQGSSLTLTPAIDCAPELGSVAQPWISSARGRAAASGWRRKRGIEVMARLGYRVLSAWAVAGQRVTA